MMIKEIKFTNNALKHINEMLSKKDKGSFFRIAIKGGGCSGLSYILDFTGYQDGDTVLDYKDFRVYLDRKSTIYLSGIRLDYQGGLRGKGFVFENPMATNTCGCG